MPLHFGAGGLHGRKDSYQQGLARPVSGAVPASRAFFCAQPERGTENRTDLTPKPCYGRKLTLKYTIHYCIPSTQSRCGRIVCRHPPLTKHRNKNSINIKLTKTGTGCLRCTSPCSGVRRQAMMGVPLQAMIHGAWASIRPTAEPRAGADC